jgi:predicted amidophosphoribosyltransferase
MESSSRVKLLTAALGLLFLGSGGYLLVAEDGPKSEKSAKDDPTRCPKCGKELPKGAQNTGICPYCSLEEKSVKKKLDEPTPPSNRARYFAWSVMGLTALLGSIHGGLILWRRHVNAVRQVQYRRMKCPACKQKIRYTARQIGTKGLCPRCRREIIFPERGEIEDA